MEFGLSYNMQAPLYTIIDVSNILVLSADSSFTGGRVGIGTDSPAKNLDVTGTTILRGELFDASENPGMAGYLLESTGSGIHWIPQHHVDGIWTKGTGDNIYYDDGDVGIGTDSPAETLDVSGTTILRGELLDASESPGMAGYLLESTA